MHLLRTATLGAVLSLASMASQAPAQEKRLKEAIVGPWVITSVFDEYQSGEKRDNWGGPVTGQLTFGRTGRFSTIIIGPSDALMKTDDPRKPDALIVAYYGSYTVDEAGKKINGKIEGASYSPRVNMDTTWTVQGSDDKLTLIGSPRRDQHGTFSPKLEVKRPWRP
jgi:Lipocalin-like domain